MVRPPALRFAPTRSPAAGALLLLVASTWTLAPAPAEAQRERVEGIAALVGGSTPGPQVALILRSDVELRARMALAAHARRLPTGEIPEGLLAATLEEIIGELLIAREADRLRASEPRSEEVRRERSRLEAQAGGRERLAELLDAVGADGEEVGRIARRRAYVAGFLRTQLEGSATVGDAELERLFEREEHPFVGRDFERAREAFRVWVGAQRVEREVRRWVEVLRGRTEVRVLAEWRRSEDDGEPEEGEPGR